MTTCKRCGNPLLMTMGGRCRFCNQRASVFRQLRGTPTFTRAGAVRILEKELEKRTEAAMASGYMTPLLAGMTWQQAEQFACKWMVKNGYRDAVVTAAGPDGGVDISSRRAVGQVKHHAKAVGIAEVQRLAGIAGRERKQALLFSANGVTAAGLQWAKANGVACYSYPPITRLC